MVATERIKHRRNIYFEAFLWLRELDISGTEFRVLTILCTHMNKSGTCFPGQTSIASEAKYKDTKQVRAALQNLERLGCISITQRSNKWGHHKSNQYELHIGAGPKIVGPKGDFAPDPKGNNSQPKAELSTSPKGGLHPKPNGYISPPKNTIQKTTNTKTTSINNVTTSPIGTLACVHTPLGTSINTEEDSPGEEISYANSGSGTIKPLVKHLKEAEAEIQTENWRSGYENKESVEKTIYHNLELLIDDYDNDSDPESAIISFWKTLIPQFYNIEINIDPPESTAIRKLARYRIKKLGRRTVFCCIGYSVVKWEYVNRSCMDSSCSPVRWLGEPSLAFIYRHTNLILNILIFEGLISNSDEIAAEGYT